MFGMRKKELPSVERSDNPYLNAQQIWFEQYGRYIVSAARWRFVGILALLITLVSISCNLYQMHQDRVVRYFVAIDELGKTVADKITNVGKDTPQRVVQAVVADFITNWRSVTVDRHLQNNMISYLSSHVGGAAKGMLTQWYSKNSPYEIAKKGNLVQVEIRSLPVPISNNTYRVEWFEVVRALNGIEVGRFNYEAMVTVQIIPPETEEMVLKNPGGVYIVEISTAKVLR